MIGLHVDFRNAFAIVVLTDLLGRAAQCRAIAEQKRGAVDALIEATARILVRGGFAPFD